MERAELVLNGSLPYGKALVVCPDKREICFEDRVTAVLPPVPKLKQGERAILVVEVGKPPHFKVRQAGVSRGESMGTSLFTIVLVVYLYHKYFRDIK